MWLHYLAVLLRPSGQIHCLDKIWTISSSTVPRNIYGYYVVFLLVICMAPWDMVGSNLSSAMRCGDRCIRCCLKFCYQVLSKLSIPICLAMNRHMKIIIVGLLLFACANWGHMYLFSKCITGNNKNNFQWQARIN